MAKVSEEKLEELYNDLLDQVYPTIKFGTLEYDASRVLKKIDPIAWRQGFLDWLNGEDNCEDCDNNPLYCTCEEEE